MTETSSHSHKTFQFKNAKERLHHAVVWAVSFVTWMLEFPYSLKNDDKNRVGIAILDHYGESYVRNGSL